MPLDNSYRNTVDFVSPEAQSAYFVGKTKYMFTDFTYQRQYQRLRVPVNIEQLFDCNYVMYLNSNFTNKWFYAFIVDLEYANPNMTYVTIEQDVFQTWLFEYRFQPSFILREHVEDDTIGANLVPEDLDTGEYIYYNSISGLPELEELMVVVASTSTEFENVQGNVYNGIYSGCQFTAWDITGPNGANAINDFLDALDYAGKGDAISTMFMYPKAFIELQSDSHIVKYNESTVKFDRYIAFDATNLDGYEPKNNKMFTYPYFFLKVATNSGNDALFEYEYWEHAFTTEQGKVYAPFTVMSAFSTNPTVALVPRNYKYKNQSPTDFKYNFDNMLTLSNYPQVQWSYGAYENWFAQNSAMINFQNARIERNMEINAGMGAVDTGAQVIGALADLFTLNLGGAASGALGALNTGVGAYQQYLNAQDDIKQNMLNIYQHSIQPPQTRGGTGGLGSNVALGIQNFFFYSMGIRAEYAKRIDDYFSFYGYKVNEFKIPNTKSRKSWNYIQTIDCNIIGSFPDEHINVLKRNFNKGVTIWHDPLQINNYDQDNGVVS